jgi:hypothetical protein
MGRIQEEPVRKSEKAIREAQARSISARPVRRTQIPKNEDRQQPIGIPVRGFIFLESQGEFLFSPSHKKQRLITSWSSIPLS